MSNLILDYNTAPNNIKNRLIAFNHLDASLSNIMHQVVYNFRHGKTKGTIFYKDTIYELKNASNTKSKLFLDKKKYFENVKNAENDFVKKDFLMGAAMERLDEVKATKMEVVKALVEAGLKPTENGAYQVFYYNKSMEVAEFVYNYVKNKYGIDEVWE